MAVLKYFSAVAWHQSVCTATPISDRQRETSAAPTIGENCRHGFARREGEMSAKYVAKLAAAKLPLSRNLYNGLGVSPCRLIKYRAENAIGLLQA